MTRSEMEEMFKEVAGLSRHLAEVTPLEVGRTREALSEVVDQARPVYMKILGLVRRRVKGASEKRKRVVKQLDDVYGEVIAPIARCYDEAKLRAGMITRDLYDHLWGGR